MPNAKQLTLKEEHEQLKLYLTAIPDKQKANEQLIAFFKKNYQLKVRILRGNTSRKKVIEILE